PSSHFFLPVTPPAYTYPLSLHDALPISFSPSSGSSFEPGIPRIEEDLGDLLRSIRPDQALQVVQCLDGSHVDELAHGSLGEEGRSEEHTSELQSRVDLVCRLLLEKKKNI